MDTISKALEKVKTVEDAQRDIQAMHQKATQIASDKDNAKFAVVMKHQLNAIKHYVNETKDVSFFRMEQIIPMWQSAWHILNNMQSGQVQGREMFSTEAAKPAVIKAPAVKKEKKSKSKKK